MKKVFVLSSQVDCVVSTKDAKKSARLLKKAHEAVFGPNSCEVVILPPGVVIAEVSSGE